MQRSPTAPSIAGVPQRAQPSFAKTEVGDLVLFVPWIGIHDGGIRQVGIVRARCPVRCYDASRILWPDTPNDRLFPYLFFFNTEIGFRGWFSFLEDTGISERWHPRGWYREIGAKRFDRWGGPAGYLKFRREDCGFKAEKSHGSAQPKESTALNLFPDELRVAGVYEGGVQQVMVNSYERNPEARRRCIEHYGANCRVCGMDFRAAYGTFAEGFIHVHHLKPLSEIGERYVIDPIADLRPVCPNCHAVIQLGGAACTIEEAQSRIDSRILDFWSWLAAQIAADRREVSGTD
jgi:hypothetical protein